MNEGYRGIANVRKRGTKIEWTQEQVAELIKCANDWEYFIENYIYINDLTKGMVLFKMRDYQRKMIKSFVENDKTVINSGRQLGKTTAYVGFVLWYIIFHSDKTVAVMADKERTAVEIFNRILTAYQMLPPFLSHGVKEFNKTSLYLDNNSRVFTSATSGNAIRGYSVNVLCVDEFSHIRDIEAFWTAVRPTISSAKNLKVIISSTPNGMNLFYKICIDAKYKRNEYNYQEYDWRAKKDRDDEWYKSELDDLGMRKFMQEHCCEFLGSSGTLISGLKLKEMVYQTPLHEDDNLRQYEMPMDNHSYVISCDVSRGKGLDYSAFSVIDVTTTPFNQVCTFYSNEITPVDYASVIYGMHKIYNKATIFIELNDLGEQVATTIIMDYECEYVIHTQTAGRNRKEISFGGDPKAIPGIMTSPMTKKTGCSLLKLLIEQNQLIINDENTITEFTTFSQKGASWAAEKGKHDDLVMGLVNFAWLADQDYFKQFTDVNALLKMRDRDEATSESLLIQFGFFKDDHNEALPMTPEQREYERELVENERQKRRDAYEEAQSIADANQARVEEIMGKGYVINF